MGFRIGGLLAAAALCAAVVVWAANSDDHASRSSASAAFITTPIQAVPAGMNVKLCAKADNPQALKAVKFHASKGEIAQALYMGGKSPEENVLNGGVITFAHPGCEYYFAPKKVGKEGEEVSIQLMLHGEVKDTLKFSVVRPPARP